MVPGLNYSTVMSMSGGVSGIWSRLTTVGGQDRRQSRPSGQHGHCGYGDRQARSQVVQPDRSSTVLEGGKSSDWAKFEAAVKALSLGDGTGLRFLSETVTSLRLFRCALTLKISEGDGIV